MPPEGAPGQDMEWSSPSCRVSGTVTTPQLVAGSPTGTLRGCPVGSVMKLFSESEVRGEARSQVALRYGVAVVLPVIAAAVKVAAASVIVPTFILHYPVVMLAATLGGLGPGLVATGWSALLAWFWIIPPGGMFNALSVPEGASLMLFVAMGVFMTLVAARYRASRDRSAMLAKEAALSETNAKFRRYVESAPIGLFVLDGQGRLVDFNPAALELIGYEASALSTMTFSDLHGEGDWPEAMAELASLASTGWLDKENQLVRSDGQRIRVALRGVKLAEDRYMAFCQDVTYRKMADEALRASEARFRLAIEEAPFPIMIHAEGGDVISVNRTWTELTGYGHEDIPTIAAWTERAYGPRDREVIEDINSLYELKSRKAEGEYVIRCRDGSLRTWDFSSISLGTLPDSRRIALSMAADVTERKQALAEHERLATALAQAAEAVVITDAGGTIEYVNPAFEKITGYSSREAIGQNPRILKSGVQDDEFYRKLWETICQGRTWRGRMVNRKKDGTFFTEEATISPVRNAVGTIATYVAVKRDITDQLALEAQLLQSQKMEGIGRLAGGIAHDFNNLLSVVLSSAEFALEGMQVGDPIRQDVQQISDAGKRAALLTKQLLAFSRKQVMQPVAVDLNEVLGNMEPMLRRIIGEDIDLVLALSADLGLARADHGQIEQVILNLATNARDAMREGGKLTLETRNVNLDVAYSERHLGIAPGPHVMVAVTDSGVGMDEATLARVFEPFFTTKGPGQGSGLGLSTVYGIVNQSGGGIYVYSEVGRGTTFKIYLPRDRSLSEPDARPVPALEPAFGSEVVLLVEDDESVRMVAERILVGAGFTVLPAESGPAALLVSEQHPAEIHLVLTDVVMPGMSGRVLVDRLTKDRPDIRALFMSGYTDNAIVHQGVLDPGTHFISKPITRDELLRKVQEVLHGS